MMQIVRRHRSPTALGE